MVIDFRTLANPAIRNLIPYQPGKPLEELERELGITSAIKLASNENALGPSPKALIAAAHALQHSHIYPDGNCFSLKKKLAQFLNVDFNQLTMGNGSENILEMIIKSYLKDGDAALISEYAFLTIPLLIESHGGEIIRVPAKHFSHDVLGMIASVTDKTRLVFIVNPNNPTGTYITEKELILLLQSIPSHILVVLDEAYHEYIDKKDYPDALALLEHYPNLVITRTFSKVYGLAALRLGYAISSPQIADILNRARLPFNVNTIAAIAAEAALEDQTHIHQTVKMNRAGMQQIEEGFKRLGVSYIPSIGNFIAFDIEQNVLDIYQKLLLKGVIVRPLLAYQMNNYLRVTIGTEDQNNRFLTSLKHVLGKSYD